MVKTKDIVILGRPLQLQERSKAQMKGVTIGDSLAYKFYDGEFHGMSLLFAEPKGKIASPRSLSVTASNLTSLLQRPTVFLLPTCPAYERQRLIDKDVYFIASDKYVHLPMLLANERIRKTKQAKALTPVAQYLLLYHLQIESIEGLAARDIEDKMPYSYASITLGITCLEDLGLCQKVARGRICGKRLKPSSSILLKNASSVMTCFQMNTTLHVASMPWHIIHGSTLTRKGSS